MKLINKTDPFDKHSENKTDEVHASNGSHGKKRVHIVIELWKVVLIFGHTQVFRDQLQGEALERGQIHGPTVLPPRGDSRW